MTNLHKNHEYVMSASCFYRFLRREQCILVLRILRYNDVLHIHDQKCSLVMMTLHELHIPLVLIKIKGRTLRLASS